MHMCVCVVGVGARVVVVGGWGVYVCEYCMHIKKGVGMNQELHMWKHFQQKQFP